MELCILILTFTGPHVDSTTASNPHLVYSSVKVLTVTFTSECTFREKTLRKTEILIAKLMKPSIYNAD